MDILSVPSTSLNCSVALVDMVLSMLAARALRRKGNTLQQTFLMVLAGVITSSCYRSLSSGTKQTMIQIGAKIMVCSSLVRGMMFVKDVRKQLSQIMQKMARGSLDVRAKERWKESRQDYKNLRKALCAGYAGQLAERMIHHNGYRTLGLKSQLVQVHPSSVLRADEDGMLPNYVLYHELVVTTRPYMRNVCAVEMSWVMPILKKLENLNINKLSGGSNQVEDRTEEKSSDSPKKSVDVARPPNDAESRIQAARDRFMARKAKR
ncbi:putative pre-mRNA-splicing factor ATP-dependent RNA helicase DEAH4 [Vitis vinifera]|uniref:Putative pre-mRNA-splicing factor ATP-dependent RNA helicase DEAH4 n=1 Tax=Vitis vinifera TaxID=29760 RepID=A0A438I2J5_VITVI|nr:putative pre-mRNA-splicing factor ATP-dependent RNA helicase DEAH4 [Vitis vinifera]